MKPYKSYSGKLCGCLCFVAVLFLTLIDQYTKHLAVRFLKEQPSKVMITNVLELKYLENRGIAFGMLQGQIILFLIVCILFLVAAAYIFYIIPKNQYYLPLIMIGTLIVSGAIGNFIDRFMRGFVVDFIYVSLIHFPIFNIADIYVVCGGILLVLFVALKYKEEDFDFLSKKRRG